MLIFSNIIGSYFQLLIINCFIFIGATLGFYLIILLLHKNKFWNKNPKFVKCVFSFLFGAATSCFGFFYLNNNLNYYFLFLIINWLIIFNMNFDWYFLLGVGIIICILIGVNYSNNNNINSLIINYLFFGINVILVIVNKLIIKKKNLFFINIIISYLFIFLISILINIKYPIINIKNDLEIDYYFFYGILYLFSFLTCLFCYVIVKWINYFFKKSSNVVVKDNYYYNFHFINKLNQINDFIYQNNINQAYLFLIKFKNNNYFDVTNFHSIFIDQFKNYKYFEFYYDGYYFVLINSIENNKEIFSKLKSISLNMNNDLCYYYDEYGISNNDLKQLTLNLIYFSNLNSNFEEVLYKFDHKWLIEKYSLINKKYALNNLDMINKFHFIYAYEIKQYKNKNFFYYKNINVNNNLISLDEFYSSFNNEYIANIFKTYLDFEFIKDFNKNNFNKDNNYLIIDYPTDVFTSNEFDIKEFINHFKQIDNYKNIILNFEKIEGKSNKKILSNYLNILNKNEINFYLW